MADAAFLLAIILAGLHAYAYASDEKQYRGPVIYTNLPPPVLYFPRFPERPRITSRGDSTAPDDPSSAPKRGGGGGATEYVPYPHKDLPLLVYQSETQPPVHVVQPKKDGGGGYQTGPAVYREEEGGSGGQQPYSHEPGETPSASTINVGLSTSQGPPVDPANPQYISIGVTSLQGGENQPQQQYAGPSVQQFPGQYAGPSGQQYSGQYASPSGQYHRGSPSGQYSGQSSGQYAGQGSESPAFVYYPGQYSDQTQAQIPVEQLTQAIQSYLAQQSGGYLAQQSGGGHQAAPSYSSYSQQQPDYPSYSSGESVSTPQHVGITIIRPSAADAPDQGAGYLQAPPQYGETDQKQQFLSIGVFPISGGDVGQQQQQQYYSASSQYDDYRNAKHHQGDDYTNAKHPHGDDYRNAKHHQGDDYSRSRQPQYQHDDYRGGESSYQASEEDYRAPPYQGSASDDYRRPYAEDYRPSTGDGPAGYQVISIDLSALRNQQQQQHNAAASYQAAPVIEPPPPPPLRQPPPEGVVGREKEFQQILIQIPHKILSEPDDTRGRVPPSETTPYTGTAQVANVVAPPPHSGHSSPPPTYYRPAPPPLRQPKESAPPAAGLLSGGINIAIIKQAAEPTHHAPPVIRTPPEKQQRPSEQPPRRPAAQTTRPVVTHRVPVVQQQQQQRPPRAGPPPPARPPPVRPPPRPHQSPRFHQPPLRTRAPPRFPIFASSNMHFATASLDGNALASVPSAKFEAPPTQQLMMAAAPLRNPFSDVSFDEIDAFLSPGYDLFGQMGGQNKKKVEDETRFLQKVASELLSQEMVKQQQPPLLSAPLPYKYWEQPRYQPPAALADRPPFGMPDAARLQAHHFYSHMQQPHNVVQRQKGGGSRKQRVLGKGYLRRKLSALRSSIRGGGKSKIAPRSSGGEEGGVPPLRPALDGVSIPLHQVLSSRISTEEEDQGVRKSEPLPPIIIYKGPKEPVEVYGDREDIEKVSTSKDDVGPTSQANGTSTEPQSRVPSSTEASVTTTVATDRWLPVAEPSYALAEDDAYDRNETRAESFPAGVEASIKRNLEELFSLLGDAEAL